MWVSRKKNVKIKPRRGNFWVVGGFSRESDRRIGETRGRWNRRIAVFALRALQDPAKRPQDWTVRDVRDLAREFEARISTVRLDAVNVLPLLHAIVARKFRRCHERFSGSEGNYFDYVGRKIAEVLIEHRTHPRISRLWM